MFSPVMSIKDAFLRTRRCTEKQLAHRWRWGGHRWSHGRMWINGTAIADLCTEMEEVDNVKTRGSKPDTSHTVEPVAGWLSMSPPLALCFRVVSHGRQACYRWRKQSRAVQKAVVAFCWVEPRSCQKLYINCLLQASGHRIEWLGSREPEKLFTGRWM